jgi:uncharacterized RDD family membrane protein YckC
MTLFWKRLGACFLDMVVLFFVLAPFGFLVQRALGFQPVTGPEIWVTLLLNFSIPVWIYFALWDASRSGATIGKRVVGLRVYRLPEDRVPIARAWARTAVKLLPWELTHLAAFAFAHETGGFTPVQTAGLVLANGLALAYLAMAAGTRGERSVHDLVAGTVVRRAV